MYKRYNNFRRRNYFINSPKNNGNGIINAIRAVTLNPKTEEQSQVFVPKNNFEDFPIQDVLKKNILYRKYNTPTPIQDSAIPSIMEGRDVIGIANTGTGKTAAFLIPLVNKIIKDKNQKVLVITPTRELAAQISDELYAFTYGVKIRWSVCVGGMSITKQISDLEKNPEFVLGTPGRLKDLAQRAYLHLDQYNNVVLDEADRMVDMGFIHDIKYFISRLPSKRQSLFFSATIPPKVDEILRSFVSDPVTVSVKTSDVLTNITHELIKVDGNLSKLEKLLTLLGQKEVEKVLIFGRTRRGVQKLSSELISKGYNAAAIHGDKNQGQRQKVLNDFKSNRISILLATDVASRGIDVKDISHVINFDLPATFDDYIHRIGRTGRSNSKGVALTFI
jgi:ATP-dependent RNA helicase RhlE